MAAKTEEEHREELKKEYRRNAGRRMALVLETGAYDEAFPVVDALADWMHLCDEHGIDFDDQLRLARQHFDAEKEGMD